MTTTPLEDENQMNLTTVWRVFLPYFKQLPQETATSFADIAMFNVHINVLSEWIVL
jgi:hypothetical protein